MSVAFGRDSHATIGNIPRRHEAAAASVRKSWSQPENHVTEIGVCSILAASALTSEKVNGAWSAQTPKKTLAGLIISGRGGAFPTNGHTGTLAGRDLSTERWVQASPSSLRGPAFPSRPWGSWRSAAYAACASCWNLNSQQCVGGSVFATAGATMGVR